MFCDDVLHDEGSLHNLSRNIFPNPCHSHENKHPSTMVSKGSQIRIGLQYPLLSYKGLSYKAQGLISPFQVRTVCQFGPETGLAPVIQGAVHRMRP